MKLCTHRRTGPLDTIMQTLVGFFTFVQWGEVMKHQPSVYTVYEQIQEHTYWNGEIQNASLWLNLQFTELICTLQWNDLFQLDFTHHDLLIFMCLFCPTFPISIILRNKWPIGHVAVTCSISHRIISTDFWLFWMFWMIMFRCIHVSVYVQAAHRLIVTFASFPAAQENRKISGCTVTACSSIML